MKRKLFKVNIYYSSFCTHEVEAESEADAIDKARNQRVDSIELLANLECWKDADTVEVMDNEDH